MSAYNPPSENVPVFDSSLFRTANSGTFTKKEADALYLHYPIGQGNETIPSIITGSVSYQGDSTTQSSAYTGAKTLAGSYTNTNMTIDANGKITALANGSAGTSPFVPIFTNMCDYQSGTSGYSQGTRITFGGSWGVLDYCILRIRADGNWGNTGSGWTGYASTTGFLMCRPAFMTNGNWATNLTGSVANYSTNSGGSGAFGATQFPLYYTGAINNGTQSYFYVYSNGAKQFQLMFLAPGATGGWGYSHSIEYICHSTTGGSVSFSSVGGTNNSLP